MVKRTTLLLIEAMVIGVAINFWLQSIPSASVMTVENRPALEQPAPLTHPSPPGNDFSK